MLIRVSEEHLHKGLDTDVKINPILLALNEVWPDGDAVNTDEDDEVEVYIGGTVYRWRLPPAAALYTRRYRAGWHSDELGTIEFELETGGT